jgi:hypothetical protein
MLKRPEMNVEILLNSGEKRYTFPNASFSLLARNQDEENTPDVIGTLKKYFDPELISEYELEIENDGTIYEAPLKEVLNTNNFLNHINREYGRFHTK